MFGRLWAFRIKQVVRRRVGEGVAIRLRLAGVKPNSEAMRISRTRSKVRSGSPGGSTGRRRDAPDHVPNIVSNKERAPAVQLYADGATAGSAVLIEKAGQHINGLGVRLPVLEWHEHDFVTA